MITRDTLNEMINLQGWTFVRETSEGGILLRRNGNEMTVYIAE